MSEYAEKAGGGRLAATRNEERAVVPDEEAQISAKLTRVVQRRRFCSCSPPAAPASRRAT